MTLKKISDCVVRSRCSSSAQRDARPTSTCCDARTTSTCCDVTPTSTCCDARTHVNLLRRQKTSTCCDVTPTSTCCDARTHVNLLRRQYDISLLRRQTHVNLLRRGNTVTNALLAFNSSINFIIYCLVGKKFRDILTDILRCRRRTESRRQLQYLATTRL